LRHLLANVVTYTIGVLLLLGAALFGWMRSRQWTFTREETVLARFAPAPPNDFVWQDLGRESYVRNCANCHGRRGEGWDQYPGLSHLADLFEGEGGRDYVIDLHLYGLTGDRFRAPMPPMRHIPDVEMAAVLNHTLTNFGNERRFAEGAALYTPGDIAERRGKDLSPWDVNRRRPPVPPARPK